VTTIDTFFSRRLGLFIHWGIYAIPGWQEQHQLRLKTPRAEYAKLAAQFNPTAYDPDAWLDLAEAAGMTYLVFTTKHHDGFALHNSKVTNYDAGDIVGRDLVREIVDALRAEGLRAGFYHSVIDWHHDQYAYARSKQLPHPLKGRPYPNGRRDHAKYQAYLHQQVDELVSNYGPVDVLWWDYSAQDFQGDQAWRATELMKLVRSKQPGIIMNNRLFRTREAGWAGMGTAGFIPQLDPKYGDFITPEQHIPATGMPGVDWETCMTMNTTWGYSEHDQAWKSDETLIRNLIDIASKGGNYLLNIGPRGDGSVPPESVEAMRAIGAWMKVNGEAIYGTSASPFQKFPWGRCTRKVTSQRTERLYLHVFDWPGDGELEIPALDAKRPVKASLLAGNFKAEVADTGQTWQVRVPPQAPDSVASVVVLDVEPNR